MQRTQPDNVDASYLDRAGYYSGAWRCLRWDAIAHLAPVSPSYVLQSCDRVLYASSGAVYEGQTEYAKFKRRCENLCGDQVIARLFTFVGERLHRHSIYELIQSARKYGIVMVNGSGKAIRSYLYGEDLGRWMWKILLEGNGVYDVGSAIPYTILEAARIVADETNSSILVLNIPGIPESKYLPNISRARELGCEETTGLKEAIKRIIAND